MARISHRPNHRIRHRNVFALMRLRRPAAEHSLAEAELLRKYARDARTIVEIGVAEGGSAFELRQVMDPGGTLYLVDPYNPGRLGMNVSELVARRVVDSDATGSVVWLRHRSEDAGVAWTREIDFLFIDGDHSYPAVLADWKLWTPHVREGGHVVLHDAETFAGGWTGPDSGPVRVAQEVAANGGEWERVDSADSMVVFRRAPAD